MSSFAVIFDLDGVLTDTAELHFQSWMDMSRKLGVPFDRQANEALRGLSRTESLRLFLGAQAPRFTPAQQADIAARKNERYVVRLADLSPRDLLPGMRELLAGLGARGVPLAVASSSKNALLALDKLGIRSLLAAVVDGNDVELSKPDPRVFLAAAERLHMPPTACVVIEDAASGVAAARAAGMKVIGVGPAERVGQADVVVATTAELSAELVLKVLAHS